MTPIFQWYNLQDQTSKWLKSFDLAGVPVYACRPRGEGTDFEVGSQDQAKLDPSLSSGTGATKSYQEPRKLKSLQ